MVGPTVVHLAGAGGERARTRQMLSLSHLALKPGCGKSWVELLRAADLGKGFIDLDVDHHRHDSEF